MQTQNLNNTCRKFTRYSNGTNCFSTEQ